MGVLELLWMLPGFFLGGLANRGGMLSNIAWLGLAFLIAGLVTAFRRPNRRLWLMVIPIVACQVLTAVAGVVQWGVLTEGQTNWVLAIFFFGMLAATAGLVYLARGARPAAAALGLFAATYILFACVVSAIAFGEGWP
ncbi:MAG: hypothetical protein V4574_07175 [Pseudomonadota bacterium]